MFLYFRIRSVYYYWQCKTHTSIRFECITHKCILRHLVVFMNSSKLAANFHIYLNIHRMHWIAYIFIYTYVCTYQTCMRFCIRLTFFYLVVMIGPFMLLYSKANGFKRLPRFVNWIFWGFFLCFYCENFEGFWIVRCFEEFVEDFWPFGGDWPEFLFLLMAANHSQNGCPLSVTLSVWTLEALTSIRTVAYL